LIVNGTGTITGNLNVSGTTTSDTVRANTLLELPSEVITDGGAKSINIFEDVTPTGGMIAFAGAISPSGWLLCDGSAVSRATYADLFSLIGVTYGIGDGSTTFNLPNMSGNVPVGRDLGDTDFDAVGKTGGSKENTLTLEQMPPHRHAIAKDAAENTGNVITTTSNILRQKSGGADSAYLLLRSSGGSDVASDEPTVGLSSKPKDATNPYAAQGAQTSLDNVQPFLTLNWIIKT
jgi:microcystin-dependent protein